jgi:hypothetical protein
MVFLLQNRIAGWNRFCLGREAVGSWHQSSIKEGERDRRMNVVKQCTYMYVHVNVTLLDLKLFQESREGKVRNSL